LRAASHPSRIWAVEYANLAVPCTCNVTNLARGLYGSSQTGIRGQFEFRQQIHPITHGKLSVGTTGGMVMLGLRY